jgi:uncharacterized protein YraI
MKRLHTVLLCSLIVFFAQVAPGLSQTSGSQPVVAFVTDDFDSTEIDDTSANGASELSNIFTGYGAEVREISLNDPIATDVDLVVIINPRQLLSAIQTSHLWAHIAGGGNFLLVVDPNFQDGNRTEASRSGIVSLLDDDFGVLLQNTVLAESWFVRENAFTFRESMVALSPAQFNPHPVIAPLVAYDMDVQLWGARNITVEPFTLTLGGGVPLLQTETAYAETTINTLNQRRREQLEYNIPADILGQVNAAALGTNGETGARIAVVGDSEVFINGFGLLSYDNLGRPAFPGNRLFIERLAGWLLGIEDGAIPSQLDGITPVVIDGNASDWQNIQAQFDPVTFVADNSTPFTELSVFRNAGYLYVLAEPTLTHDEPLAVQLGLDTDSDEVADVVIRADEATVLLEGENNRELPDARVQFGNVIELKVPVRFTGPQPRLTEVCLLQNDSLAVLGCIDTSIQAAVVNELDGSRAYARNTPLAAVDAPRGVNLRNAPSIGAPRLRSLPTGNIVALDGISEDGNWLYVHTNAYEGWVSADLMNINTATEQLPILPTSEDEDPLRAFFGLINTTNFANVRSGPSTDFPVVTTVDDNESVTVIGVASEGEWLMIHGADFIGWIAAFLVIPDASFADLLTAPFTPLDDLQPTPTITPSATATATATDALTTPQVTSEPVTEQTATPSPTLEPVETLLVTVQSAAQAVNVRGEPSLQGEVVATASRGQTLSAIGRNTGADWILVESSTFTGWIAATLLAVDGDFQTLPIVADDSPTTPTFTPSPAPAAFVCPDAPAPRLTDFAQGRVIQEIGISFRAGPRTSDELISFIPNQAIINIIGGPNCFDGFVWWQVSYDGEIGWVAEGDVVNYYIEPVTP